MARSSVSIREGALWVGGERVPLLLGEVHFWRVSPARWPRILDSIRRLGLEMIATYVAWEFHELAPGRFDFEGRTDPARNLVGFLELVRESGFRLLLRPGPYAYAEWTNAGVPERVVGLPRISERYRAEARVWMEAVVEAVRPFFAVSEPASRRASETRKTRKGRSGPIVLFQPDNEFDLFSHWFERECGLDQEGVGFFQQFLNQAYGGRIGRLNEAWGTRYRAFDEVRAFAEPVSRSRPQDRARARDYWRFQHWAVAEGIRWHAEEYRRLGVRVPMVANYYPGGDVQNWRVLSKVVDLVGIDWYPRNEFGAGVAKSEGASMTGAGIASPEEEHRRFLDTCRYQRAISPIPWSPELQCGIWHGYHDYVGVLTPNHYRLLFCSAMIAGLKGINWYMLVGRDNWYMSPINERGDLRPELAAEFLAIHRVWGEVDPPSLEKLTGACAFIDPVHAATDGVWAENAELRALYDADADFEIADAEAVRGSVGVRPLMFYAGADWLERSAQRRLADYVLNGGTLVLFRRRPVLDEAFRPYDGLGLIEPTGVLSRLGKKVEIGGRRRTTGAARAGVGEGAVWLWDERTLERGNAEPIRGTQIAGTQQAIENADAWMNNYRGQEWVCGYREPRGRRGGSIIQIGLPASASLVRSVHRWRKAPLYSQAESRAVHTSLARRGRALFLFATNLSDGEVRTRVTLDGVRSPSRAVVVDLFTGRRERLGGSLSVTIPRRSGGAWRIGTS